MNWRSPNGNIWNDISFRDCGQSQFNYYGQVPHHGRDFHHGGDCGQSQFNYYGQVPHHGRDFHHGGGTYVPRNGWDLHSAGGTYVPHHTPEPTIPALGPLHRPQPRLNCKICDVKLCGYKSIEEHNLGKKHRRMLKLREETDKQRISNGQIPNSQVDLAGQPKRILKSGEKGCAEIKVISEATSAKHKNYVRKDKGVTPEVPAEGKPRNNTSTQGVVKPEVPAHGKPRDDTSAQSHNFKRKIDGAKTGKYMKTNDGARRPMESSKLDTNSRSASVISPIQIPVSAPLPSVTSPAITPLPVEGSSFKFVHQRILTLQTQVWEGNEIPNPTVETRNHPHVASSSNINTQPKALSSDSEAKVIKPSKMGYCKICEVRLPPLTKDIELHNKGKRHQRELKLQQRLGSSKSSYGQISNSHKNLVVQSKTVQITETKQHMLTNMSSEASILEQKSYLQKVMGLTSEFAAKGPEMKPTDNSGYKNHGFNYKSRRAKRGKHKKKNLPMESSKVNIISQLKSVEFPVQNSVPALAALLGPVASHIIAPTLLVESSLEPQIQHISSSKAPVLEGNEHYEIENRNLEVTDQSHAPADSDIKIQIEDMGSNSAAMAVVPSEGFMTSQVFAPSLDVASNFEPQTQHVLQTSVLGNKELPEIDNLTLKTNYQPSTSARSSSEPQIELVLHIETESQLSERTSNSESRNCVDEKNNQLVPSVLAEFNSPSCHQAISHSADGCSNHEQKMDIIMHQSGTTQQSQLAVCLNCGDVGFQETLVFCKKCQVYAIHRYCLDGPVIFTADVNWFCDCEPEVADTSAENVSLNSANISSQNSSERVKNKQGQQNMEAKTMALLSDNHSLSHHGLSQCSNNTEREEFGKECQPAPKDEANNTEGSMILTVPHPIAEPVWRGSLRLSCPSIHTVLRLLAHMSTLACSKVLEETKLFPDVLCPDLLSRTAVWPKSFMNCGPNDDSIALYFFPDTDSVERSYDKLVDHMMSGDLAIRAVVENADLLIFPSVLLPIQCRRFQEKYYLWGVFRERKNFTQYK
ncbi:uncharacterized protein LOC106775032 isoform X2 [Vigna radiata var. radiata]|uniref:Uncharacterized protein LOC106775032 isoform X2 n=1 Tax=Vigna radiata var. radiata TaxID=3916 RepID=A0A1S3VHG0_VIGRR|nr:uncharacterized protein LOC106775032 isoform X2 [Vigna radiata var. radiata]